MTADCASGRGGRRGRGRVDGPGRRFGIAGMPVQHPPGDGVHWVDRGRTDVFEVGSGATVVTATFGTSFDELRQRLEVPLVRAPS